jgi:hypothetical protein
MVLSISASRVNIYADRFDTNLLLKFQVWHTRLFHQKTKNHCNFLNHNGSFKRLLPDEDSNLDKQNQNLSYCLYTIGQNNFGMAAGSGQK